MREIKFRAWDKYLNMMQDWLYLRTWTPKNWNESGIELMQYTGLKDKSGREIYEGDIVSWYKEPMTIIYAEVFAGYQMQTPNELGHTPFHAGDAEVVEVIGNIYENPELLKGEECEHLE